LRDCCTGASVAAAGTLKVGTYEGNDGSVRASLDMAADEIASTTPRPKKHAPAHREHQGGAAAGDPFADDVDWMGACMTYDTINDADRIFSGPTSTPPTATCG
jgi:single-stranded DNA-binding protein